MAGSAVLLGRRREQETLDRLIREVRGGRSRVLVLRGEAGAGKSALLDHAVGQAAGGRVVRAAGVELESEIAYATLQQLCAPLLVHLDRLPDPQRAALATAFGLSAGDPPEVLLLGLAVLHLFAEAAADQPLICVVDDAQWLDRMSEVILTFVARRLDAESVALIVAARISAENQPLAGLPELAVDGLADADARALLESALAAPVDDRVRDRIVAETRGNPLALIELPRGLTAAELAFGFGTPSTTPLAGRVEEGFQRRIAVLPEESRRLLLTAAVEPVGDVTLLWRALERMGVGHEAAAAAESAGLIEFGPRVRFRHPLVRSATWRSAGPAELRAVHEALAAVTDPDQDPDRRAWHRAHATVGFDDEVATELECSADRALARGGRSAAASFLERAAELSPDPQRRASLLLRAARARADAGSPALVPHLLATAELAPLDPLQQAGVERLRAHVAFVVNPGRAAVPLLLAAAGRLAELDPAAARGTYLQAIGAAVYAGRLGGDDLHRVATAARRVPSGEDFPGLLLTGLIAWVLDGHAASVPLLRRALAAMNTSEDLGLLWLASPAAIEVFQIEDYERMSEQAVRFARGTGALSLLPTALLFRAANLLFAGRFGDAAGLIDEGEAVAQATGMPAPSSAAMTLAAYRGREQQAVQLLDETVADARARGAGRMIGLAGYARAVLFNSLGRYATAFDAARQAMTYVDLGVYQWTLTELIEAAVRTGETAVAAQTRDILAERTAAAGTDWAVGALALADALTGPPGQAEARYREAIERLAAGKMDMHRLRAQLLYGEWLRRENRRSEARNQLRAAHEAFTTMGALGFADRAGRELVATGETVRKRGVGANEQLTSQESQIVRLAVTGRTNPEIAATLYLSPRTVEWHLRKVFTKLGVASRRELAAALQQR